MTYPITLTGEQKRSMFDAISVRFNIDELNIILFKLNINNENIPHSTKNEFVSEIIGYCERQGLIYELIRVCKEVNPVSQESISQIFVTGDSKVNDAIRDFSSVIEDRTEDFTGRTYLLQKINQFLGECRGNRGGYIRITGEPGIGKSAFAAHLVKTQKWVHHFNIRQEGDNTTIGMLQNLSAQIISRYKLKLSLFKDGNLDAPSFREILEKVSQSGSLASTEPLMIVVDALDEIEDTPQIFNTGGLPFSLLPNIFFVVTNRPSAPNLKLDVANSHDEVITHNAPWHSEDVKKYLAHMCNKPNLKDFLEKKAIKENDFISIMSDKSENNFMYLKYILPDIIKEEYEDFDSRKLPQGLNDYYKDHWNKIKNLDRGLWDKYTLPILAVLSDNTVPITLKRIIRLTNGDVKTGSVIKAIKQFLHEGESIVSGERQKTYRLYHLSFRDYLKNDEEIQIMKDTLQKKEEEEIWRCWTKSP